MSRAASCLATVPSLHEHHTLDDRDDTPRCARKSLPATTFQSLRTESSIRMKPRRADAFRAPRFNRSLQATHSGLTD
jgi:hypothetical protein